MTNYLYSGVSKIKVTKNLTIFAFSVCATSAKVDVLSKALWRLTVLYCNYVTKVDRAVPFLSSRQPLPLTLTAVLPPPCRISHSYYSIVKQKHCLIMQCFCVVYIVKKTLSKFCFILFLNFNISIYFIEILLFNIELSLFVKTLTYGKRSI